MSNHVRLAAAKSGLRPRIIKSTTSQQVHTALQTAQSKLKRFLNPKSQPISAHMHKLSTQQVTEMSEEKPAVQ